MNGDWTGHEDDMVIELANEVRKVLGTVGAASVKEKKLVGLPTMLPVPAHISAIQLRLLPEVITLDS